MTVHDPVADLALADAASRRLAGRAGWVKRYHLLFAAYWFVWTVFYGLAFLPVISGGEAGLAGFVGVFLPLVLVPLSGLLVHKWADRHGVVVRGWRRARAFTGAASALLSIGLIMLGWARFPGEPAYWVPAAAVVAIPSLVAAVVAGRAAGPR